jgi:GNAT superfamily N-acetyltransferase
MRVAIETIDSDLFHLYSRIANWYEVRSVLRVDPVDEGLGGFAIVEEELAEPFIRDYDSHHEDNPARWARQFNISRWGIFLATNDADDPVGGAAVALDAPVYPLDRFQRPDLAVLWDIRVDPDHRRSGVGTQLLARAAAWARARGYGQLGIETDSSNVGACRFYAKQGCEMGAIHRFGYSGIPAVADHAMLLWYLEL